MDVWVIYYLHTKNWKDRSMNTSHASFQIIINTLAFFLILTKSQSMKIPLKIKTLTSICLGKREPWGFFLPTKMPQQVTNAFLCFAWHLVVNSLAGGENTHQQKYEEISLLIVLHQVKSKNNQYSVIKPRVKISIMFSSLSLLD